MSVCVLHYEPHAVRLLFDFQFCDNSEYKLTQAGGVVEAYDKTMICKLDDVFRIQSIVIDINDPTVYFQPHVVHVFLVSVCGFNLEPAGEPDQTFEIL